MSLMLPALALSASAFGPLNGTAKWLQHEIQDALNAQPVRQCTLEEIREEDRLYTDYLVSPDSDLERAFTAYIRNIEHGRCVREAAQGPLVNQLCYRGQWGNCLIQQTPITITVASNFQQQTEGFLYDLEHCPIYTITVPTGAVLDSIEITLHFMGNGQTGPELAIRNPIMIANVMGNAVGAFSFAFYDDYHTAVSFDTGNPQGNREENSLITIAKPPILPIGKTHLGRGKLGTAKQGLQNADKQGLGRTSLSTGATALSDTTLEDLLTRMDRWTSDDVFEVNEYLTDLTDSTSSVGSTQQGDSESKNDLTVTAVPMGSNFTMQVPSFVWDSHCRVVNLEGYLDWSVSNNGVARQSIMIVQTQGTRVDRIKRNIVACIYPWLATNLNLLEASVALTISGGNYGQLMLYATKENPERVNVREYAAILPFSITTNYLHPCNAWPDLNIIDYTRLKERLTEKGQVSATDILIGLGIPHVSDWRRLSKNYTVRRDANAEYLQLGETAYKSKCGQELSQPEEQWSTDCTMLWECNEIVEGPCTAAQLTTNVSEVTTYPTTETHSALTNIGAILNTIMVPGSIAAAKTNMTNVAMVQPHNGNSLDLVSILRKDPGYKAFFAGLGERRIDDDDMAFLRMSTFNTARHHLLSVDSLLDDPSPNYLGTMVSAEGIQNAEVIDNLLTQLVQDTTQKGEVNFHVVACTPIKCPTTGLSITVRRRGVSVTLANTGTNTVHYLGLADEPLRGTNGTLGTKRNRGQWTARSEIFASSIEVNGASTNSTMSTTRYVRS